MKFIFLTLLSLQTIALSPHTAHYSLALNGWNLANESRILQKNANLYTYTAHAQTTGLAKFIKDYQIDAKTNFIINGKGVDAKNYHLLEKDGDKIKKNVNLSINSKAQTVSSNDKIWHTEKGNIVDSISLFLALANDLKNHPQQTQFDYQVADGKKIKQRHYEKISTESLLIQNKPIKTIKITDNKGLEAWFAPIYDYLPVLIKKDDDGNQYQYQLTYIKIKHLF